MAGASWEVWLDDPFGTRLVLLDQMIDGTAAKVANTPGACSLTLPALYDKYLRLDGIVEIWRRPEGGSLKLFNAYFVRQWEYTDDNGQDITIIGGPDGLGITDKRIVAYDAGTTDASASTEAADDLLKRVVRFACCTAATDTDRDLSAIGVTVAPDATKAPTVSLSFSRRELTDLFADVADASRTAGTNLYYDFVPIPQSNGTMGFEFRTYTNQPGQDRTGADLVVFGREWGNLNNCSIALDYTDEKTVCYAGGRGTGDDRAVEEVEDTTRAGASPWARIEGFYNVAGMNSTTAEYVASGQSYLSEHRPKLKITGEIVDTPQARFGVDWNWGDRVSITYRGYQFDAVITAVTLNHRGGRETIRAAFEVQP